MSQHSVSYCGKTILLVDDDPEIVRVLRQMLVNHGYNVIPAESPVHALQYIECHKEDVDLLLTDVVMPEMNGHELSDRVRSIIPGLKVLFISGYSPGLQEQDNSIVEGVNFIKKPFSSNTLCSTVFNILSVEEV